MTIAGGSTIGIVDIPFNELGIPSSSLRGVMRTAVSNLLPNGFTSCGEIEPNRMRKAHGSSPCDVCRLYGYPDSKDGGCFTILMDQVVEEKHLITRVSIDDKTQKAKDGSLFTQQIIKPGREFKAKIIYRCEDDIKLFNLLLYSLSALRYWRLGRNAMVDVKVLTKKEEVCNKVKCNDETEKLLDFLSDYLWR
ncbi:hypothetical protein BFU36_00060 [Sulfolobus sp. A20]|nr:hypothetical protein BFU36_00060 [Sulfolobus sp. A20]